ncbi:MAG: hypothetical protein ACI9UU_000322 [Candidatus Azotimanducaceae bacterium]|jgi:hypothetical protein
MSPLLHILIIFSVFASTAIEAAEVADMVAEYETVQFVDGGAASNAHHHHHQDSDSEGLDSTQAEGDCAQCCHAPTVASFSAISSRPSVEDSGTPRAAATQEKPTLVSTLFYRPLLPDSF